MTSSNLDDAAERLLAHLVVRPGATSPDELVGTCPDTNLHARLSELRADGLVLRVGTGDRAQYVPTPAGYDLATDDAATSKRDS